MKKEILLEELNSMKYLLGYKRGMVISEQVVPAATTTTAAPATAPATAPAAAPATGTTAPVTAPATVTVEDLIKQIQTILNTKFGGQLTVDGKWGPKTQTALEVAIKTLTPAPAAGTPASGTTAPVASNTFSATNPANKVPELNLNTTIPTTLK